MFNTSPNDLIPVVVETLQSTDRGSTKVVVFEAVAAPGRITLRYDDDPRASDEFDGVLLTLPKDLEAGMNPGSLFAVTRSDRPFPLFRRTPEDTYVPDPNIQVTDVQGYMWRR